MTISSDNVKATAYVLVGLTAIYAAWRVIKVGESATEAVGKTLSSAKDSVLSIAHKVGIGRPDLENLPSNDGYPEPPAIRKAIDSDAVMKRIQQDEGFELMTSGQVSAYVETDSAGRYMELPQDYSPIDGPGNDKVTA
jgi:hypothetical protein